MRFITALSAKLTCPKPNARPIRHNGQVPDRNGKIFYTSITSLSHISKNSRNETVCKNQNYCEEDSVIVMRYKIWVVVLLIFIFFGVCFFLNGKEYSGIGYGQNKLSYSSKTNAFYFDQLDFLEKKVCNQISELIVSGNGGVIYLEEKISTYQYLRVSRTLSFDPEHQMWPLVLIFPVEDGDILVDRNVINDEKRISKLYVQVNDEIRRDYLHDFKIVLDTDNTIININELEKICNSSLFSTKYYEEQSQMMDEYYDEIISEMPCDITERDAIQFFLRWIRDNIEYDYSVYEYDMEPYYQKMYENEIYADLSNKSCIIDKRAICSGISIVFSELCNRVGINAYPVFGTVNVNSTVMPHGWVAVEIDNSTYYVDPSYVCETGKIDGLMLKNEMERTGERVYRLEESFVY